MNSCGVGGPARCEEAAKRCTELARSVSPPGRNIKQTVGQTLIKRSYL